MYIETAKITTRITTLVVSLLVVASTMVAAIFLAPTPVSAADTPTCANGYYTNIKQGEAAKPCVPGGNDLKPTADPAFNAPCKNGCLIDKYVNPFIKLLAALVGIIVTVSIVYGGIQYASSAGDPGKITAAKKRIFNSILALLAFLFLSAFLSWITPGGL